MILGLMTILAVTGWLVFFWTARKFRDFMNFVEGRVNLQDEDV